VTGGKWSKLVAFVRRFGSEHLAVLVPRLAGSASATSLLPIGTGFWGGTTIDLPKGQWRDVFEGRTVDSSGSLAVGTVLERLPFAVMRMTG
jgi:(1->4)-alpha-D-glucan 1-alpha-D-glucosylmutase